MKETTLTSPLVSVIVPNYNHSSFLKERIDSILNQTYNNFEIIILDDCSKDSSRNIIESYRTQDKVKYIVYNETNSGCTFIQWKKGIELASGEYIWIAESDDFASKYFLESLMNAITIENNVVVGFTNSFLVDKNSKKIQDDWDRDIATNEYTHYNGQTFIAKKMLYHNRIYNASSAVFKKDVFYKISDEYLKYRASGDYLFWILLIGYGDVIHIHNKLNYFRQHSIKVSPGAVIDGTVYRERYKQVIYILNNVTLSYWDKRKIIGRSFLEALTSKLKFKIKRSIIIEWIKSYPLCPLYSIIPITEIIFKFK